MAQGKNRHTNEWKLSTPCDAAGHTVLCNNTARRVGTGSACPGTPCMKDSLEV
jgi:hypothetical protein